MCIRDSIILDRMHFIEIEHDGNFSIPDDTALLERASAAQLKICLLYTSKMIR